MESIRPRRSLDFHVLVVEDKVIMYLMCTKTIPQYKNRTSSPKVFGAPHVPPFHARTSQLKKRQYSLTIAISSATLFVDVCGIASLGLSNCNVFRMQQ